MHIGNALLVTFVVKFCVDYLNFFVNLQVRDQEMNVIKVDIDKEGGQISVFNNGKGIKGIPIEIHEDENVYIPQLIFSQLFHLHF